MCMFEWKLPQATDAPVQRTRKNFTNASKPIPTTPEMRASPRRPSSKKEVRICPCKLGGLCWSAAAPRPDICARLAQLAARLNSLKGSEVYRSNDLANTVKARQHAAIFRNAPCPHYSEFAPGAAGGRMRAGGEKVHTGALLFAGWPHAAYGDHTNGGRCRLGCVIGLVSPALRGHCRIIRSSSILARKSVVSNPG